MNAAITAAQWIFAGYVVLIAAGAAVHLHRRPKWRRAGHRNRTPEGIR